jgi:flavin-binding protein dodecin
VADPGERAFHHPAAQTLRGVEGAWAKDMNVLISDGQITGYKVNLAVTFELEDSA